MNRLTSIGCFFLDTCVILSDILKENTARIEKFKKDITIHNVPCYVSDSVKKETYKKVQQTLDFLGNIVRDTLKRHLEFSRQDNGISLSEPMTSDDIKFLEDLFHGYRYAMKVTKVGLMAPVDLIEQWAIAFLGEKIDEGARLTINKFSRKLVKNLLQITSTIEDLYDELIRYENRYIQCNSITPDSRIVRDVKKIGIHSPDCEHIASAMIYQIRSKEKSIFITFDYNSILSKREKVVKKTGIECCSPMYGLHHLI